MIVFFLLFYFSFWKGVGDAEEGGRGVRYSFLLRILLEVAEMRVRLDGNSRGAIFSLIIY